MPPNVLRPTFSVDDTTCVLRRSYRDRGADFVRKRPLEKRVRCGPTFLLTVALARGSSCLALTARCLWAGTAVFLTACTHLGPKTIPVDRFDYGTAIADSWKQQILLNIVKGSDQKFSSRLA